MWTRAFLMILLSGLIFAGCKSKRKVSLPTSDISGEIRVTSADHIKTFEMSNLDFRTFTGRAKTKLEMGKDNVKDVTLNVRMERDKAIWISISATLGIEVARVLITPDSVKVINKLQGEYMAKPFKYIHQYTNSNITFSILQDLLMANVSSSLLRTESVQVANASDEFIIVGIKEQLSYQYRINRENRPFNLILQEVGGPQNLEAFYGSFANVSGYNFPQNITLNVVGDDLSLKAQLGYNKVGFNENIEMPFSVSSRYKVIN